MKIAIGNIIRLSTNILKQNRPLEIHRKPKYSHYKTFTATKIKTHQ